MLLKFDEIIRLACMQDAQKSEAYPIGRLLRKVMRKDVKMQTSHTMPVLQPWYGRL